MSLTQAELHDHLMRVVEADDVGESLSELVASVDWSGVLVRRPKIADVLGDLEAIAGEHGDGLIDDAELIASIKAIAAACASAEQVRPTGT